MAFIIEFTDLWSYSMLQLHFQFIRNRLSSIYSACRWHIRSSCCQPHRSIAHGASGNIDSILSYRRFLIDLIYIVHDRADCFRFHLYPQWQSHCHRLGYPMTGKQFPLRTTPCSTMWAGLLRPAQLPLLPLLQQRSAKMSIASPVVVPWHYSYHIKFDRLVPSQRSKAHISRICSWLCNSVSALTIKPWLGAERLLLVSDLNTNKTTTTITSGLGRLGFYMDHRVTGSCWRDSWA